MVTVPKIGLNEINFNFRESVKRKLKQNVNYFTLNLKPYKYIKVVLECSNISLVCFKHFVIVISVWNLFNSACFPLLSKDWYAQEYKYYFRLPFSGCKWFKSMQINIYFWYGNFRYEDFNYLFQDLFEKEVVNTFI